MILSVTISGQQNNCTIPSAPIVDSISANVKSFSLIYYYLRTVDGKGWLDHATKEAAGEMISDLDELVKEARAVIKSARASIPWYHKYLINPVRLWLQKLK